MAIYHFSAQVISKGKGKSCVAAAAYRSGEKLENQTTGETHDYTRKERIEHTEIIAPENAPEWATDRQTLWNEVEKIEKAKDSQLAREINIALPVELNKEQQKELIRDYVKENFVSKGMVADISIHDKLDGNPHAHVMLTMRPFKEDGSWGAKSKKDYILDGKGQKTYHKNGEAKSRKIESTDWNKKETLENWREQWANYTNKALEKAGFQERINHRSYKDRGIDQVPTIHLGKASSEMQKQGIDNVRVDINNEIKELNKQKVIVLQEYKELKAKLDQEKSKEFSKYSYLKDDEKESIIKAEKVIGEPQTYENSVKALDKLKLLKDSEVFKYRSLESKEKDLKDQIANIINLNKAEGEFKELPRNMFGQYKDKDRAASIASEIDRCNSNLIQSGYKHKDDLTLKEKNIEELNKQKNTSTEKIERIDTATDTINKGVKSLQNKEVKEFYKKYKDQYPQTEYLRYDQMKAIKAVSQKAGRLVSIEETKSSYNKVGHRIDEINKQIKGIDDNGKRLINAKQALDTIDKYKDIAETYDNKLFGKEKYQQEHQGEKWQYDNAKVRLKEYGVKDIADFKGQEAIHNLTVKNVLPKLNLDMGTLSPGLKLLHDALQAWKTSTNIHQNNNNQLMKNTSKSKEAMKEEAKKHKDKNSMFKDDELEM